MASAARSATANNTISLLKPSFGPVNFWCHAVCLVKADLMLVGCKLNLIAYKRKMFKQSQLNNTLDDSLVNRAKCLRPIIEMKFWWASICCPVVEKQLYPATLQQEQDFCACLVIPRTCGEHLDLSAVSCA